MELVFEILEKSENSTLTDDAFDGDDDHDDDCAFFALFVGDFVKKMQKSLSFLLHH
jgi:hypothetical protein